MAGSEYYYCRYDNYIPECRGSKSCRCNNEASANKKENDKAKALEREVLALVMPLVKEVGIKNIGFRTAFGWMYLNGDKK